MISQINAVSGVVKARHYIVQLRKIQEVIHLGIAHTTRVDSADNWADMFTKALPVLPFWRLSTSIMGDEHSNHPYVEFRQMCLKQELNGGSVKRLNDECRLKAIKEKAEAKGAKDARRASELNRRQAESGALVEALSVIRTLVDGRAEKPTKEITLEPDSQSEPDEGSDIADST